MEKTKSIPKDIYKMLDWDFKPQNRFVIVKYRPEYYVNGVYTNNEWSSFADIGRVFNDKLFSLEEYLIVEDRYVSCIKDMAIESSCKYLTIGYMENRTRLKTVKANGEQRTITTGSRLLIKDIDDVIKRVLREEVWIVFLNRNKRFVVDFGYDYYLHVRCQLRREVVSIIVNKNNLFFDPRR